ERSATTAPREATSRSNERARLLRSFYSTLLANVRRGFRKDYENHQTLSSTTYFDVLSGSARCDVDGHGTGRERAACPRCGRLCRSRGKGHPASPRRCGDGPEKSDVRSACARHTGRNSGLLSQQRRYPASGLLLLLGEELPASALQRDARATHHLRQAGRC